MAALFSISSPRLLAKTRRIIKMSWTCKKCTFINDSTSSSKPTCQICLSPPSPPSILSSSNEETLKWSCKACTFLNPYKNTTSCEMCASTASLSALSSFDDLNDISAMDSSVGSVFLPLRTCKMKISDSSSSIDEIDQNSLQFRGLKAFNKAVVDVDDEDDQRSVKLGGFQGFGASNKAVTVVKGEL